MVQGFQERVVVVLAQEVDFSIFDCGDGLLYVEAVYTALKVEERK